MADAKYYREYYQRNLEKIRKRKREYARKWRLEHLEYSRKQGRKKYHKHKVKRKITQKIWYEKHKHDEKFIKKRREIGKKYYYNNKKKWKIHQKVYRAITNGKLIKPSICPKCGETKPIEGHHPDYRKPLGIIWVCKQCHENIHHPASPNV